jgi:hypothetical protein
VSPEAASEAFSRLRSATSSVTSTSSTNRECGAVNLLRTIFSAIFRRSPRMAMRWSAPAEGSGTSFARGACTGSGARPRSSAACTSAFSTLPCGPVPEIAARSIPCSRAIRRVTGVARTFAASTAWAATGGALGVAGAEPAGAAAGAPPVTSMVRSGWCTLAISPSLPWRETTFPARGAGTVTVALSVISSTTLWSSSTVSPGCTSHLTISPSTTPSPRSGSLNSNVATALSAPRRDAQACRPCSMRPFMKNSAAR